MPQAALTVSIDAGSDVLVVGMQSNTEQSAVAKTLDIVVVPPCSVAGWSGGSEMGFGGEHFSASSRYQGVVDPACFV